MLTLIFLMTVIPKGWCWINLWPLSVRRQTLWWPRTHMLHLHIIWNSFMSRQTQVELHAVSCKASISSQPWFGFRLQTTSRKATVVCIWMLWALELISEGSSAAEQPGDQTGPHRGRCCCRPLMLPAARVHFQQQSPLHCMTDSAKAHRVWASMEVRAELSRVCAGDCAVCSCSIGCTAPAHQVKYVSDDISRIQSIALHTGNQSETHQEVTSSASRNDRWNGPLPWFMSVIRGG